MMTSLKLMIFASFRNLGELPKERGNGSHISLFKQINLQISHNFNLPYSLSLLPKCDGK